MNSNCSPSTTIKFTITNDVAIDSNKTNKKKDLSLKNYNPFVLVAFNPLQSNIKFGSGAKRITTIILEVHYHLDNTTNQKIMLPYVSSTNPKTSIIDIPFIVHCFVHMINEETYKH